MATPLIAQGTLNRLRASLVWSNFSNLNVTAPYLAKAGIRFAPQGEAVTYIATMTGSVTSPEPYMQFEATVNLIKPQALADLYKQQIETNALLGDGTLRPDVNSGLGIFQLVNCAIRGIREIDFSGEDPTFAVNIGGYWLINSALYG